jgi:hypothetical protein
VIGEFFQEDSPGVPNILRGIQRYSRSRYPERSFAMFTLIRSGQQASGKEKLLPVESLLRVVTWIDFLKARDFGCNGMLGEAGNIFL